MPAFRKSNSKTSALADEGRSLAIDALAFIASHDDLERRFLDLTGAEASQIREGAGRPEFLVGVLEFILENEPDVLDFASRMAVPPKQIGILRNALAISASLCPLRTIRAQRFRLRERLDHVERLRPGAPAS